MTHLDSFDGTATVHAAQSPAVPRRWSWWCRFCPCWRRCPPSDGERAPIRPRWSSSCAINCRTCDRCEKKTNRRLNLDARLQLLNLCTSIARRKHRRLRYCEIHCKSPALHWSLLASVSLHSCTPLNLCFPARKWFSVSGFLSCAFKSNLWIVNGGAVASRSP